MNTSEKSRPIELLSHRPAETIELGRKIGKALTGGEIIALTGPLGSGKTHLIKGIVAGTGASDLTRVNSPTFVLINEYTRPDVRLDVFHIDLYRIDSIAEFEMLGFDDLCSPTSIVLIEWADKVQPALQDIDLIRIKLSHINENRRNIQIRNIPAYLQTALM